jgi:hypothetical protein
MCNVLRRQSVAPTGLLSNVGLACLKNVVPPGLVEYEDERKIQTELLPEFNETFLSLN